MTKINKVKKFGYTVHEMWECDFLREMRENPEIEEYVRSHALITTAPLNPRDAFYGGSTGNFWEYYEVKGTKKINYVDVWSLYPWVRKYGKFPISHPKLFVGEVRTNFNLNEIEGLIKCTILPPKELYHPVLPIKMNNKLMFVLSNICGKEMGSGVCNHNDEKGRFTEPGC